MDIGTAKPEKSQRERIPHHCIDIRNPDAIFSAGEYGILARSIVEEIFQRGHIPIVVGGSGLYIRALVDGIFSGNYRDPELRKTLNQQADEKGLGTLYAQLKKCDPEAAVKIHPNDRKRILRALEVCELSGIPISRIQSEETRPADFEPHFWGLRWPREVLYRRIEDRVDAMIRSGLVQEVENLKKMGFGPEHNGLDSVGYREIFHHLAGEISLAEAVGRIKMNTRRFAKKQLIWFRRDKRIRWVDVQEPVDWHGLVQKIVEPFSCP